MSPADIREALRLHSLWLGGSMEGRRADLSDADLSDADLSDAVLRDADLRDADLRDADLSDADLRGAVLRGAVLRGAVLRGADLSGADLSGVPVIPELHQRIAEAVGEDGARLEMGSWHGQCGTTHCRAGWAIHLAGEQGYALEGRVGPSVAGALIYAVSTGDRVPDFYADDEDALLDIRECARRAS